MSIAPKETQSFNDVFDLAGIELKENRIQESHLPSIWETAAHAINILHKKPQLKAARFFEIFPQISKKKGISYVIKYIITSSYITLNQEEFFVWTLLDGTKTIADICHCYYLKYNKISPMPAKLIEQLEIKNMLKSTSWNIYAATEKAQVSKKQKYLGRFIKFFLDSKFSLNQSDRLIEFLYRAGGKIFFKIEMLALYFLLVMAGLFAFFWGGYFLKQASLTQYIQITLSITVLLGCVIFPVLLHELAHAFACKNMAAGSIAWV